MVAFCEPGQLFYRSNKRLSAPPSPLSGWGLCFAEPLECFATRDVPLDRTRALLDHRGGIRAFVSIPTDLPVKVFVRGTPELAGEFVVAGLSRNWNNLPAHTIGFLHRDMRRRRAGIVTLTPIWQTLLYEDSPYQL